MTFCLCFQSSLVPSFDICFLFNFLSFFLFIQKQILQFIFCVIVFLSFMLFISFACLSFFATIYICLIFYPFLHSMCCGECRMGGCGMNDHYAWPAQTCRYLCGLLPQICMCSWQLETGQYDFKGFLYQYTKNGQSGYANGKRNHLMGNEKALVECRSE